MLAFTTLTWFIVCGLLLLLGYFVIEYFLGRKVFPGKKNENGLFQSVSRIKLDENSWLESFSPEERLYCEQNRKLLVHLDLRNDKSLLISLPKNWGTASKGEPLFEEQRDLIAAKLKKYFEADGCSCHVEYFDPWKE